MAKPKPLSIAAPIVKHWRQARRDAATGAQHCPRRAGYANAGELETLPSGREVYSPFLLDRVKTGRDGKPILRHATKAERAAARRAS